jgi:hypothetical protein
MGSKFVEKHKRKSVLAALLFIFQGRTKYVGILLVLTILSIPFVISGETLNRMLELRPVAAFLRTVGLGGIVSAINPKYSNDLLRAALDKASQDSEANSYWAKFLKSINATLPPGGGPSSIAMLRGGGDDIFGPPVLKDGKNSKRGPGQVKGAVNDDEKANGEGADGVDLQGLLGKAGQGGGGLYGDQMGQNLAGNFANGSAGGSGPYAGRTLLFGGGGSRGSGAGMYSKVMGQSGSKVPVPGSPQKVNTKLMGRVSGFSWRNVGYKTNSAKMDVKLNNKKPMFQLAETFAMTGAAFKSKESALEYQASYTGTTYDGNDANLDVIQTDASAPIVPDTSFTGDLIAGTNDLQEQAKACSEASGTHGAAMSEDGKMMEEVGKTLGKPPKCCSSGVGAWNAKINRIIAYCNDYNGHEVQLSAACQNKSSPMNCTGYNKMIIKPCSKLKCFLAILLMILLGGLFGIFGAIIVGVLAVGSMMGNGSMFGPVGDMVSGFISTIAGG